MFTLIHIYLSSHSHFRLLCIACQFGLDNVECMLNFVVFWVIVILYCCWFCCYFCGLGLKSIRLCFSYILKVQFETSPPVLAHGYYMKREAIDGWFVMLPSPVLCFLVVFFFFFPLFLMSTYGGWARWIKSTGRFWLFMEHEFLPDEIIPENFRDVMFGFVEYSCLLFWLT